MLESVRAILFVENFERSREFYEKMLNLKVENDFGNIIEYEIGFSIWKRGAAEEFIFGKLRENCTIRATELYFEAPNLEAIYDSVKGLGEVIHEIRMEPWGQKVFRLFDPDDYIVEIGEPMVDVVKRSVSGGMKVEDVAKQTGYSVEKVESIVKS